MTPVDAARDERLAEVLERIEAELRSRGRIDLPSWLSRHPDLADDLPALVGTLRAVDTAVSECRGGTETPDPATGETGEFHPPTAPQTPARFGRYAVTAELGGGGMGTVYRAHDSQLRRDVAVKVPAFRGSASARAAARERFLREARAAAAVRHPNVCPIHDVGEQDGVPYVIMALVEGGSFSELGAVEPRRAADLVRQAAEGLAAVHAAGIVHRDVKPANILIDPAGQALMADFGLARSTADADRLTADGGLVGTPAYMAPEQASLTAGAVGPVTDVYSLGAVLYELLAGRPPFAGNPVEVIYRVMQFAPPPPSQLRPDLDPGLEAIVLRAMARRPEDRYPTAAAFADALRAWLAGPTAATTTVEIPTPAPPKRVHWIRRAVAAAFLGLAAVMVAAVIIIIRDKNGKEVARIEVPEGGTVEIQDTKTGPRPLIPPAANKPDPAPVPDVKPPTVILKGDRLPGLSPDVEKVFGSSAWRYSPNLYFGARACTALAFSPNGGGPIGIERVGLGRFGSELPVLAPAVPSGDTVRVWDVASGRELRRFTLPNAGVAVYQADVRAVAMVSVRSDIEWTWKFWDLDTGAERVTLKGPGGEAPQQIVVSPDWKTLVTPMGEVWDAKTGKPLPPFIPRGGSAIRPNMVAFSPDSSRVLFRDDIYGDDPKTIIRVFEVATRKELAAVSYPKLLVVLAAAPFTPDGRAVAVYVVEDGDKYFARLWDLDEKKWREPKIPNFGPTPPALSPDGTKLVAGGAVYNAATGQKITDLGEPRLDGPYVFSSDGKQVAVTRPGGEVATHDATTGKKLSPNTDAIVLFAASRDGTALALAEPSNTGLGTTKLRLVDAATGKEQCLVEVAANTPITHATFSPDNKRLAIVCGPQIKIYDALTGDRISVGEQFHNAPIDFFPVTADGRWVATGGQYHADVKLWDTTTGKLGAKFPGGGVSPAIAGDGSVVAMGMPAGEWGKYEMRVFEAATGKKRFVIPGERKPGGHSISLSCAVSPDGTHVAFDGKIYDATNGKEVLTLKDWSGKWPLAPTALAFAPDGKTLFATGWDTRVVRWSVSDGTVVKTWQLPAPVRQLSVTADGRFLITGNANGTVYYVRL